MTKDDFTVQILDMKKTLYHIACGILRSEAERGRAVVFTAASLKDVMGLGAADRVCFATGEDFAVYTPEEIAARREALGGEGCSYDDLAGRLAEGDHV